ncbi:DUF4232 domain-containing protein [Streptomyces sp. MN03-5084-2B]|nr:DUF4232 domain-containing protein [Streptomyces sp. MN03-5084-2B]
MPTTPLTSTTAWPSTSASAPATTASGSAGGGPCTADDVRLELGQGDAGAGSRYRPLRITNVSGTPCTVQGFPGVSYVTAEGGHEVGEAAVPEGDKGAPVRLGTGETAAATIQFVNIHNYDPAQCRPTPVQGLRIHLSQGTAAKFLTAPGTGCASTDIPGHQLSVKSIHPV